MKKKINILHVIFGSVMTVVLAGLVMCSMTSCKNTALPWGDNKEQVEQIADSVAQLAVHEYANPVFESADEAVVYRDLTIDGKSIDSVFNAMPDKTLFEVATVCIKRVGGTTKKDIVNEYLSHTDIYNNLPQKITSPAENTAPPTMEESSVRKDNKSDVISTSYRYHTDTVDGKAVKVQIKEEKTYVK